MVDFNDLEDGFSPDFDVASLNKLCGSTASVEVAPVSACTVCLPSPDSSGEWS